MAMKEFGATALTFVRSLNGILSDLLRFFYNKVESDRPHQKLGDPNTISVDIKHTFGSPRSSPSSTLAALSRFLERSSIILAIASVFFSRASSSKCMLACS